nr:calcium-transporting atpase 8, plasma membrane-type [Quercus suber]
MSKVGQSTDLCYKALYQVTVLLVLSFQGRSLLNLEGDTISHALKVKNTLIFNSFVLLQTRKFCSCKQKLTL